MLSRPYPVSFNYVQKIFTSYFEDNTKYFKKKIQIPLLNIDVIIILLIEMNKINDKCNSVDFCCQTTYSILHTFLKVWEYVWLFNFNYYTMIETYILIIYLLYDDRNLYYFKNFELLEF